MGKDGAGGAGTSCSGNCKCKSAGSVQNQDAYLATLVVLNKELDRLHRLLDNGDGDSDEVQMQLSNIQDELIRVSRTLIK